MSPNPLPLPPDAHEVDLTAFALIPEYKLAMARDTEDHQYSVTGKTSGIKLDDLQVGMRLRCVVMTPAFSDLTEVKCTPRVHGVTTTQQANQEMVGRKWRFRTKCSLQNAAWAPKFNRTQFPLFPASEGQKYQRRRGLALLVVLTSLRLVGFYK